MGSPKGRASLGTTPAASSALLACVRVAWSPVMPLDLDATRKVAPPIPAATLLPLRDRDGLEIFVIVRHPKSTFLGGAIAFPGGKVDPKDADARWSALVSPESKRLDEMHALAPLPVSPRTFAIAACRESLEEAALIPAPGVDADRALALREALKQGASFVDVAERERLSIDLAALVPFARWVTPTAEARRFDTVFFLVPAPDAQVGVFDRHETTDAFWATPQALLQRWEKREVDIWPPTVRCLELLTTVETVAEALALAARQKLGPICPQFVAGEPPMLTLPGDPLHDAREPIVAGKSRFVMRDGRFVGEDPAVS